MKKYKENVNNNIFFIIWGCNGIDGNKLYIVSYEE